MLDAVEKLSVLELADLVKAMEENLVFLLLFLPVAAVPPLVEEMEKWLKRHLDVILTNAYGQKIAVIKVVRGNYRGPV